MRNRERNKITKDTFKGGRTVSSGLALLLFGYFFFLVVLLPLFFEGGYELLGEVKSILYLRTAFLVIALTGLLFIINMLTERPVKQEWIKRTDAMLLGFFGIQIISTVLSPYPHDAFFGVNAWRTGFITQITFLFIFLAFRRFGEWGAIHRLMIYGMALLMEGMTLLFLPGMGAMLKNKDLSFATLGNSNWFLGPMVLSIAYAVGSQAMRGKEKKELICMIAAVAAGIPCLLLTGTSTGVIMSVWLVLCSVLLLCGKRNRACRMVLYGVIVTSLCIPIIVCLSIETGVLSLPDAFGNGRGFIWNLCAEAWRDLPLSKKLIGVGPDSVSQWLYADSVYREMLTRRYGEVVLTNAHSDLMTKMLQAGILGTLSYLTAIFCIIRKWLCVMKEKEEAASEMMRFLFPVTAYLLMNTVLFEHVLVTPYFYLLLGTGEWYCEKYVDFRSRPATVFDEIIKTCYDTDGIFKR